MTTVTLDGRKPVRTRVFSHLLRLMQRYGVRECARRKNGWECSLPRGHVGWNEAWSTNPNELARTWPRKEA